MLWPVLDGPVLSIVHGATMDKVYPWMRIAAKPWTQPRRGRAGRQLDGLGLPFVDLLAPS